MESTNEFNIDEETISKIGLQLFDELPEARVFYYPNLENVFVMESDLDGNKMPKGSCFLAFTGQHGLVGKHLKVEELKNATVTDMKNMVECNNDG